MSQHDEPASADSHWFRQPNRRENWIGAGLFGGFGLFFVMLFVVQRGWWFAWIELGLGVLSLLRGVRHAVNAMRMKG